MRGATSLRPKISPVRIISIHAPHAGCDSSVYPASSANCYFNPRTPCGVRPHIFPLIIGSDYYFNPRTPCGVRPHGDSTKAAHRYFNPRTPCGVRPSLSLSPLSDSFCISIHAPHAGCDGRVIKRCTTQKEFQSTHPMRGATCVQG